MSDNTKIQWSEATWNPFIGCSRVSTGCENCYAEQQSARIVRMHGPSSAYNDVVRIGPQGPRWTGVVKLLPERIDQPLRWKRPRMIFVNSMSDMFHESLSNEDIAAVFGVMAACPQHTFQILTKRAERMRDWFAWIGNLVGPSGSIAPCDEVAGCMLQAARHPGLLKPITDANQRPRSPWPLPNVWLGVSVEDQQRADERIPLLLACPAAVRWVSAEPLLGPVDLRHMDADAAGHEMCQVNALTGKQTDMGRPCEDVARLSWLVIGGESGPGARPMDLVWARSLVAQCKAAGVPVFVKQLGSRPFVEAAEVRRMSFGGMRIDDEGQIHLRHPKGGDISEWPADLRVREYPKP